MGKFMPIINCAGCGHETNTACSDHINRTDGMADKCYARLRQIKTRKGLTWQGKRILKEIKAEQGVGWEKGCGYRKASAFDKAFARKLIGDR
jgi:hypothetical protein